MCYLILINYGFALLLNLAEGQLSLVVKAIIVLQHWMFAHIYWLTDLVGKDIGQMDQRICKNK